MLYIYKTVYMGVFWYILYQMLNDPESLSKKMTRENWNCSREELFEFLLHFQFCIAYRSVLNNGSLRLLDVLFNDAHMCIC